MLIGAGIGIPFQQNVLARLLGSAEFFAPLTHSAIPTRAASGTTGTFTRATTSTWQNNDGYLVTGVAGEIGFVGARRVRNLIAGSSEDFSNAAWTKFSTTVVVNQAVAPNGTLTADLVHPASSGTDRLVYQNGLVSTVVSDKMILEIYAKYAGIQWLWFGTLGGGTPANLLPFFDLQNGVVGQVGTYFNSASIEDEGDGWYRCSAVKNTLPVAQLFPVYGLADADANTTVTANGTDGIYLWGAQLEDVTAQTTQTAGEYVSVGVESAPYYHGSMVDGVKCFPTDLSGNPIPLTTILGYQAEGARTNLCLQSEDLSTTWINNNTTESTNVAVAPNGTTTADKLIESATNSTHTIYQTQAGTSGVYTTSVYLKAAERTWAYITEGNSVTATAYFDLANGVVGTISGTGSPTAKIVSAGNGWYRCSMTFTAGANANIQIGTSTGDTISSYLGDITKGVYVYGAQLELGSFASSYIPTTTIAVARNADVLTYSSSGNISGTVGAAYAEWTFPRAANLAASWRIISAGAGGVASALYLANSASGDLSLFDGTLLRDGPTPAYPVNAPTKSASTWGGSAATITNAGTSVTTAFDGDMNVGSTIDIGCINGIGGFELDGTIRNVRIWQRALSSSELQAITS